MGLSARDLRLIEAMSGGLPLVPRPYREIGKRAGMDEDEVIAALGRLVAEGLIKRLGVIVRHRELGYVANAMVAWDIADEAVDDIGRRFGAFDFVTLCYRRPRRPPDWPYNLFCMVHGRKRPRVLARIDAMARACGVADAPRAVLFSVRRFKQCGPAYRARPEALGEVA